MPAKRGGRGPVGRRSGSGGDRVLAVLVVSRGDGDRLAERAKASDRTRSDDRAGERARFRSTGPGEDVTRGGAEVGGVSSDG